MFRPENNAIVINEMENVAGRYPFADCLIYDRECKILLYKEGESLGDKDLHDRQVPRSAAQDIISCKSIFVSLVDEANTGPEHHRRREDVRLVSMIR